MQQTILYAPIIQIINFTITNVSAEWARDYYHNTEFIVLPCCASLQVKAGNILDIPVIVTEQYPKGLGSTVPEIDVSNAKVFPKTKFSMVIPEVEDILKGHPDRKSVILVGIEVVFPLANYISFSSIQCVFSPFRHKCAYSKPH